jgi:endonuclease G
MKYAWIAIFLLLSSAALSNPIDDKCPKLSYKAAPEVKADKYLCRLEYAVAYSFETKNPIYTTEYLIKGHTGDLGRTNNFKADGEIPAKFQAKPSDYVAAECGKGRCDRGHMTPDQDFSSCQQCVSQSFLMTNMVPQNYKNNEVIWKNMEGKMRAYAKTHPLFIVTGPIYGAGKPRYIGKSKIRVPDQLFKIAIEKSTGKSIAFMMDNENYEVAELPKLVVSLKEIEKATDIKFNKDLDHDTRADYKEWFGK